MEALSTIMTATLVIRNRKIRFISLYIPDKASVGRWFILWRSTVYMGIGSRYLKHRADISPVQEYSIGFLFCSESRSSTCSLCGCYWREIGRASCRERVCQYV